MSQKYIYRTHTFYKFIKNIFASIYIVPISCFSSLQVLSPKAVLNKPPVPLGAMTLSRREHLIAEEIPGPESCV